MLNREESAKLVRLARVVERAEDVFEGLDASLDWLKSPNAARCLAPPHLDPLPHVGARRTALVPLASRVPSGCGEGRGRRARNCGLRIANARRRGGEGQENRSDVPNYGVGREACVARVPLILQ